MRDVRASDFIYVKQRARMIPATLSTTMKLPALLALFLSVSAFAADDAEPLAPIFNGKDLTGWVPVNIAPGTFSVRDGELVTTGNPVGVIRTERMYENFVLELEWQHMTKGGNSGVFVWGDGFPAIGSNYPRGIEVQVLDNDYNAIVTSASRAWRRLCREAGRLTSLTAYDWIMRVKP